MKNKLKKLIYAIAAIGALLYAPIAVASTVLFPTQGGTGGSIFNISKGDMLASYSSTGWANFVHGADGLCIVYDSTQPLGVKAGTCGSGSGGSFSGTSTSPFGYLYYSDGVHSATTNANVAFDGVNKLTITGSVTGTGASYLFTSRSTTNLGEGSNLYYTDARVNTLINASTTLPEIKYTGSAVGYIPYWESARILATSNIYMISRGITTFKNALDGNSLDVRSGAFSDGPTNGNYFLGYNAGSAYVAASNGTLSTQSSATTVGAGANTAFGYYALGAASAAVDNTAIGYNAMRNQVGSTVTNGNGQGNTAIGSGAGYAWDIGRFNTALGYSAGSSATGTYNVFIGANAGAITLATNNGTSSKLFIDSNSTARITPLIFGDFADLYVNVNKYFSVNGATSTHATTPTTTLFVGGNAFIQGTVTTIVVSTQTASANVVITGVSGCSGASALNTGADGTVQCGAVTAAQDGGSNWKFTSGGSSSGGVISTTSTSPIGIIFTASSTFTNTLGIGLNPSASFADVLFWTASSQASYLQNMIQNQSNSASASAEWVATNDTGNDGNNFISMNIVSSQFNNLNYPTSWANGASIDTSNNAGQFNISVSSFAATSRINFQIGPSFATSTIQGYWQNSTASPTNFSVFGNAFLGTASTNTFSITGLTSGSLLVGGGASGPLTSTATVATSKGGTGTGTSFTPGSVVFAGASGVYSQNNSSLFWDNTNNRLSINAGAAPGSMLSISSTLPSSGTAIPGISLTVSNLATSSAILVKDNAGTSLFSISPTGGTILAVTSDTKQAVKIKNATGDTIFSIDTVNGWFTMGATSVPDRPLRVGPGTNLNINTNVNFLIQDRTDARMGAAVADSGIFLKSSGGLYAYDYFNAIPKNLALQEFGGFTGIVSTVPSFTLSVSGNSYQTATSTLRDDLLVDRYSATSVITVGNGTAGCLKIKDVSGSGFTYCKAQAGTLTCNTTACR